MQNSVGAKLNNNDFTMTYVDVDTDPSTFNSSDSDLVLPAGSEVLFAGLYWGARTVQAGDTLRSTITAAKNPTALNAAVNVLLDDAIPTNTTYTPGSLVITGIMPATPPLRISVLRT